MSRSKMSRMAAIVITVSLVFGYSLRQMHGTTSNSDVLRFDANWWQYADSDEQQGFIYGYMDCRQPPKAAKASTVDYQNAVSEMMKSQKTSDPKAVTKAIEHAWKTLKPQVIDKSAEVYAGAHGFLDGEWWGGFDGHWPLGLADQNRGYLEGYIECASPPVTVQTVRRYQTTINRHYASGHHSHDKVANVLQSFLPLSPTLEK
jgi:hypothetical protein